MTDQSDNKPPAKGKKPEISTSSSLDKPLDDSGQGEKTPDIDTSHLSLDDAAGSTGTLESSKEQETPEIDTSHLSLSEPEKEKSQASPADDFNLHEDTSPEPPAPEQTAPDVPGGDQSAAKEPAGNGARDSGNLIINNPLAGKQKIRDVSKSSS